MKEKHKKCIKNGKARVYLHHKDLLECLDTEPCANKTPFVSKKFCRNRHDPDEEDVDPIEHDKTFKGNNHEANK